MPSESLISATIIVCESVLTEQNGVPSAIRLIDILTLASGNPIAHFFTITNLHAVSLDPEKHRLAIKMRRPVLGGGWETVAETTEREFVYSHRLSLTAPGACLLTTEFNVNVDMLGGLGTFYLEAWLEGKMVAHTPLTLRRPDQK